MKHASFWIIRTNSLSSCASIELIAELIVAFYPLCDLSSQILQKWECVQFFDVKQIMLTKQIAT